MLTAFYRSTAIAALACAMAACSAGEPETAATAPEAAVADAAPAADITTAEATAAPLPAAEAAADPDVVAPADHAAMDHSTMNHAAAPVQAAPAPAPTAASDEEEQASGQAHAPGITNHSLPIDKIRNFKLTDTTGKSHELYKMTDAKAIVLTMHTKGCPIGQQLVPDFKELQTKYEAKGVKFLMLNSNLYDTPKMIADELTSFKSTIPVLKDADQSVGEPLGVERATETLVIEPGTWKILYQGPINDRVTYGRARAKAERHYVSGVVDAMLAGKTVTPSYVAPEGCILVFENRKS